MLIILGIIMLIIGVFALESAICMWLWNWVVVSIFNVTPINFWLSCGIMFLINFIIGLFRKKE
jgi:hypothetical protein